MKKGFIVGLATGLTVAGASLVLASSQIQAILNDKIKVTLNGQVQEFKEETTNETQYPITYKDRTYLPLRTVANLVGVDVDYDANSNTAILESDQVTSGTEKLYEDDSLIINRVWTKNYNNGYNDVVGNKAVEHLLYMIPRVVINQDSIGYEQLEVQIYEQDTFSGVKYYLKNGILSIIYKIGAPEAGGDLTYVYNIDIKSKSFLSDEELIKVTGKNFDIVYKDIQDFWKNKYSATGEESAPIIYFINSKGNLSFGTCSPFGAGVPSYDYYDTVLQQEFEL